ncbi:MAG: winged helix-turn-helix domain-containing protein [Deltaproteobacteria bacterium]|nr:winged helix-turn-helix domain-containing protein [Deltaproteobacteria bacterium]
MNEQKQKEKSLLKANLKALRQERKRWVEAASKHIKTQNKEIGLLKKALAKGPLTVPELARDTGLKSRQVMFYVASLIKYSQIMEVGRQGSYFKYSLVNDQSA